MKVEYWNSQSCLCRQKYDDTSSPLISCFFFLLQEHPWTRPLFKLITCLSLTEIYYPESPIFLTRRFTIHLSHFLHWSWNF